jgi:protein SCO1/2
MPASRRSLLALAFVAGLVLLGLFSLSRTTGAPGLPPGGDFTLQSADGPLALHDLRGRVVLLFFGYTACPGICPTALMDEAAAFQMLKPEERARVVGILISVDPERDTPAQLKTYVGAIHPQLYGVTGSPGELQTLARRYGVLYARQAADATGQYAVDHSAEIYVIAPDGRLVAKLPQGVPPEAIAAELRRALR